MRYFLDTEFLDEPSELRLLSIGLVAEDGREYYAEFPRDGLELPDWHRTNLRFTGPIKEASQVAEEIRAFVDPAVHGRPEFWAWFGAYDWVLLCRLYGGLLGVPDRWPHRFRELADVARVTLPNDDAHHALSDARWVRAMWEHDARTPDRESDDEAFWRAAVEHDGVLLGEEGVRFTGRRRAALTSLFGLAGIDIRQVRTREQYVDARRAAAPFFQQWMEHVAASGEMTTERKLLLAVVQGDDGEVARLQSRLERERGADDE
jgi:hypothetical protein